MYKNVFAAFDQPSQLLHALKSIDESLNKDRITLFSSEEGNAYLNGKLFVPESVEGEEAAEAKALFDQVELATWQIICKEYNVKIVNPTTWGDADDVTRGLISGYKTYLDKNKVLIVIHQQT